MVTGGVLTQNMGTIGTNQVYVPKRYYKVIYDPTVDEKMIALVLPNEKSTRPLEEYIAYSILLVPPLLSRSIILWNEV